MSRDRPKGKDCRAEASLLTRPKLRHLNSKIPLLLRRRKKQRISNLLATRHPVCIGWVFDSGVFWVARLERVVQAGGDMKKLLMMLMLLFLAVPAMGADKWDASGWETWDAKQGVEYGKQMESEIDVTLWVTSLLLYVVIFGALGMWVGSYRRRAAEGAFLSAVLGPIGLIVALLLPMGPEKMPGETFSLAFGAAEQTLILYALMGICALLVGFILYVKYLDKIYGWF